MGTAGAGRPDTGGAGGAREADDPMEGPGPIADPVTGRRGPPGEGGDARCWLMLKPFTNLIKLKQSDNAPQPAAV